MLDWRAIVQSRVAPLALRPEREREIIDELSQHLSDRFGELRAQGVSDAEAGRIVMEEFDDNDLLAREMRTLKQAAPPRPPMPEGLPRRGLLADAWQDVSYAWRMLLKNPGLAAAVVVTLALGVGANTAIFSLVEATVLQRLPIANQDRLFYVFRNANGGSPSLSYPAYAALRDDTRLVEHLVAWSNIVASLNADGETDVITGAIVSGHYFNVLGLEAARGRLITAADDVTPGAHPVAVISHRTWGRRFGGRADIVGHEIRLNGQPFTIIGIAPPDFPGLDFGPWQDVFVPMMMQARREEVSSTE